MNTSNKRKLSLLYVLEFGKGQLDRSWLFSSRHISFSLVYLVTELTVRGHHIISLLLFLSNRNEAPYLKDWIEHHRMIGFDSFILMNDRSDDETQCILDAYSEAGIVLRYKEDLHIDFKEQGEIFDACVDYLYNKTSNDALAREQIWFATHDTDEFIWFNQTETITSLKDVIQDIAQSRENPTMSLQIPRLMFGASGSDRYENKPVIERFQRRFNHEKCPNSTSENLRSLDLAGWTYKPPKCSIAPFSTSSYDYHKSISLLSAMQRVCINTNLASGTRKQVGCHSTHNHILKLVENNGTTNLSDDTTTPYHISRETYIDWPGRWKIDARYVGVDEVGTKLVINHYVTKSRQEFYERVCSSQFTERYFDYPYRTPERFFDYSESYSNNDGDDRMQDFAQLLKKRLEESSTALYCDMEPNHHSWEYYEQCWENYIDK